MSPIKIGVLVLYATSAVLVFTQGETPVGIWSLRFLLLVAAAHVVEILLFFKICQRAGGFLPGHLFNVFLFGYVHVNEIKKAQSAA